MRCIKGTPHLRALKGARTLPHLLIFSSSPLHDFGLLASPCLLGEEGTRERFIIKRQGLREGKEIHGRVGDDGACFLSLRLKK